jgi:hypothetical protein
VWLHAQIPSSDSPGSARVGRARRAGLRCREGRGGPRARTGCVGVGRRVGQRDSCARPAPGEWVGSYVDDPERAQRRGVRATRARRRRDRASRARSPDPVARGWAQPGVRAVAQGVARGGAARRGPARLLLVRAGPPPAAGRRADRRLSRNSDDCALPRRCRSVRHGIRDARVLDDQPAGARRRRGGSREVRR